MALLQTPEKDDGLTAPDFSLTGTDDQTYSLESIKGEKGTLVMFICNHCPYVKGITDRLAATMQKLQEAGIGVVAINANDTVNYPEDSFENMKVFAQENGFTFPYLLDETQEIAKAYGAVCTPDFFGFDASGVLQYRGRLDSSGHNPADENTKPELLDAMLQVAENGTAPTGQISSMGCSIKWKA